MVQPEVLHVLERVAQEGAARAGNGLSGLVGQEIRVLVPNVRAGTKADACEAVGGEEAVVLGAYLEIQGPISGHVMLLFPEARALACADLMCGLPAGTTVTPDEMALSAIGELGNVVGSAFINAVGDYTGLVLHPSTPTILHDMAVTFVQSVYAEVLAAGGEVVMVETVFQDAAGETAGLLVISPDSVGLSLLAEAA